MTFREWKASRHKDYWGNPYRAAEDAWKASQAELTKPGPCGKHPVMFSKSNLCDAIEDGWHCVRARMHRGDHSPFVVDQESADGKVDVYCTLCAEIDAAVNVERERVSKIVDLAEKMGDFDGLATEIRSGK